MTAQVDEFKARQRATWAGGDYATLAERIADVGQRVVETAAPGPGMEVLDVACGAGNATIPAARAGARVTGLDLTPEMLEAARTKAEAEGLQVSLVEGDAEALPFEEDSFDLVLSVFGHMFAPRHEQAAAEMARVTRPGGRIVIATWTPEGAAGALFRTMGPYMPPAPEYASPPVLWGSEEHVREMFPTASGLEFSRHVNVIEWDSLDGYADTFMSQFGPLVAARRMLGDERFAEMRQDVVEMWRDANEADDGTFRLPQEYLVSAIRV
jgi:ubiquinone/menaquinone biosynthesis C-methylase UbiE